MTDSLSLDHLVYGVPDLAKAIDEFGEKLGIFPALGGRHEGLGTHNAILPLTGRTYLELIASDPAAPGPKQPRPFGLDTLERPTLVTWAVRSRDIERDVERARERNYDPGIVFPMTRTEPDGRAIHWKLALPAQPFGDGLVPFVIEWGDTRHPSDVVAHTTRDPRRHAIEDYPGPGSDSRCSLSGLSAYHPKPARVQQAIDALGVDLEIQFGSEPSLNAQLTGPGGTLDLQGSVG